jgi:hypothetical protein
MAPFDISLKSQFKKLFLTILFAFTAGNEKLLAAIGF